VVPYSTKIYAFYTYSTKYKKQGVPDRRFLTQQKLIFFTRVAPRTKNNGLPIGGHLLSKNYTFYTCSTAYKKQGALDRQFLTQQKLMLFTRVEPRTKSKRLSIDGPLLSKNICFLHA
jgi:hypothetical protein